MGSEFFRFVFHLSGGWGSSIIWICNFLFSFFRFGHSPVSLRTLHAIQQFPFGFLGGGRSVFLVFVSMPRFVSLISGKAGWFSVVVGGDIGFRWPCRFFRRGRASRTDRSWSGPAVPVFLCLVSAYWFEFTP